ncbi:MAG TPA: DUF3006 domain-containing protein [Bacillota bacterium]|nr:DUF3006 domain-containing protein [Bacillota bacterium]
MKVVIDRFEAEYAVVEMPDGTTAVLSRTLLPQAKEGDVVEVVVSQAETGKRAKKISKLAAEVWAD